MLPADSKSVATALRAAPVAEVYNKEYGLYTSLPGFQKAQMNNPSGELPWFGQYIRAMGLPETFPVQSHVLTGLCIEQHTDLYADY